MSNTSEGNDSEKQRKPRLSLRPRQSSDQSREEGKPEAPHEESEQSGTPEQQPASRKPTLKLKRDTEPKSTDAASASPVSEEPKASPEEPREPEPPAVEESQGGEPREADEAPEEPSAGADEEPTEPSPVADPPLPERTEAADRPAPKLALKGGGAGRSEDSGGDGEAAAASESPVEAVEAQEDRDPVVADEGAGVVAESEGRKRPLLKVLVFAAVVVGIFALAGFLTLLVLIGGSDAEPEAPGVAVAATEADSPAVEAPEDAGAGVPAPAELERGNDPEILGFLDRLEISMVLEHADRPRIVVQQVAYGIGDVLNPRWDLRFAGLDRERGELYFEDGAGERYVLNY